MIVHLLRTFSEYTNVANDSDDQGWSQFLGQHRCDRTWTDLHEKPLVVVLGEAGIGKTIEFQNEAGRLREAGQVAFFIPLNQLSNADSWRLVLTGHDAEFDAWAASNELGYFFLDAVDEARLKSHADFERALTVVQQALGSNLARVRVAISSRVTDWSTPGVRSAVDARLAMPIGRALAAKAAAEAPLASPDSPTVALTAVGAAPSGDAFVISLDPLSNSEAHRCAEAFGLQDEDRFWTAVADGDYEFLATRPLDLRWRCRCKKYAADEGTIKQLQEAGKRVQKEPLPEETREAVGPVTDETVDVPVSAAPSWRGDPRKSAQNLAGSLEERMRVLIETPPDEL